MRSTRSSPIADAKAWGVVIKLPKHVMLADIGEAAGGARRRPGRPARSKPLLVALTAGLLGLLLIWLTATGVTRPINSVAADAQGDRQRRRRPHPTPGTTARRMNWANWSTGSTASSTSCNRPSRRSSKASPRPAARRTSPRPSPARPAKACRCSSVKSTRWPRPPTK